jgi:predicted lactoylglutathione lyase
MRRLNFVTLGVKDLQTSKKFYCSEDREAIAVASHELYQKLYQKVRWQEQYLKSDL